MDHTATADEVRRILGPIADQLTQADIDAAVNQAVTIDAAGLLPSDDGWTASYDPYWAAAEAVESLTLRTAGGGVHRFTSEGSTFEYTPANYADLAARLRAKSPLSVLIGSGIGYVDVTREGVDFFPTSDGLL